MSKNYADADVYADTIFLISRCGENTFLFAKKVLTSLLNTQRFPPCFEDVGLGRKWGVKKTTIRLSNDEKGVS